MIINYKNQSLTTNQYVEISEEEFKQLKSEYYALPDKVEVISQMKALLSNGVMIDKITKYYFRELMAKTQISTAKWTVEDVFNNKELLGVFKAKTLNNEKVFPKDKKLIKNIETAIRLGGKSYAKIPTQYPIKSVFEVLSNYNINNNFYDFSCGWGSRLLGALKYNINYYGTDPNYLLVDKLNELYNDFPLEQKPAINIKKQGSEIFIPEWENKIGLAFSSPPYFNLEDYKIGNQSYKLGMTYLTWKNNYLYPTIDNIYKYLIVNGYFCINIKNVESYNIVQDIVEYSQKIGFDLVETIDLKNIHRTKSSEGFVDTDELIYVFKKNRRHFKEV